MAILGVSENEVIRRYLDVRKGKDNEENNMMNFIIPALPLKWLG
jgi:hypothetical protein